MRNKLVILHRHPRSEIKQTNAAFPFLEKLIDFDLVCFPKFKRTGKYKWLLSSLWLVYSPLALIGRGHKVVYCDDSLPIYPLLIKLLFPWKKVIIRLGDFHSMYHLDGWKFKLVHWLEILTWKVVDDIFAISETMAAYVSEKSGRIIEVILDPVDINHFIPMPPIIKDMPVIMFHGTLTENKGLDRLLLAACELKDYRFVIVGDGPDKERLEFIAPNNVAFPGWVKHEDMPKMISHCDVGVAMREDTLGNEFVVTSPYVQYSSCDKPCVVSRREVFNDYPLQFTNEDELVKCIELALRYPNMTLSYRDDVVKNHDAKVIGEQIWFQLLSYL